LKRGDVAELILRRALATNLTLKALIMDSGITFKTYSRLKAGQKNLSMQSIAALLVLLELARVRSADRYIELNEDGDSGDRIIAMRLKDFLEFAARPPAAPAALVQPPAKDQQSTNQPTQ
jgi:transcriptional regulator with XRE-family HTH domain